MRRVPLLAGSRVVRVPIGPDDLVVRPPPPPERVADVAGAVRDALRFPLSGLPLESLAQRGGRATVVLEPPGLPLPGVQRDPRADALAAALEELERCGVHGERITVLVAGGLGRRVGRRGLETLLPPAQARAFKGRVVVHDAEDDTLVATTSGARVQPALTDTDLVLTVTAAETVVHGATGALVGACDAATIRAAVGGTSLLQATGAPAWRIALEVERSVAERVPLIGVSLVLDLPRLSGTLRGLPDDTATVARVERAWSTSLFTRLPGFVRRELLDAQGRHLETTAAFAGPPSVAHAEALVRGFELRGARIDRPVDALVVGVPWVGPHVPRERPNPITASAVALGIALRLHRNAFPVRDGGTLVLVHPLTRSFPVSEAPYAAAFDALRSARAGDELDEAERVASLDEGALAAYREGRACHPLLPYADWAACAPALERLGRVIVAGCRDAHAARALGFVPSRSIASALEMAHGLAGGRARVAVLLAPPYAPLIVGERERPPASDAGTG